MNLGVQTLLGVLLLFFVAESYGDENYYDVFGIAKDATVKEIRKAFKKMALKMHPDKNTGDPKAHDKFVRINNMYEVLKDEETREKYDKYGEEGLKEGFRGGKYESYNYYRDEFGIYDDDPEVVTLDGGDFDSAVNSGEPWFVNFYSPRCSHCHELAPTWRKFAEEMSGVVNIGAMNCRDNQWACQQNGIYSYPSLVMFVRGQRPVQYQNDRTKKELIKFVMKYVTVEVHEMWDKSWKSLVKKANDKLPWVVSFCNDAEGGGYDHETESPADHGADDDGNCPSDISKRKLAGLLNGIANVGGVDCDDSPKLCALAKVSSSPSGFYYFPTGKFPQPESSAADDAAAAAEAEDSDSGKWRFESLDPREIRDLFMKKFMPGIKKFSVEKLKAFIAKKPLLAFLKFSEDTEDVDVQETQLKKLPRLLEKDHIAVAKVTCDEWCKEKLMITKDATVVFKGIGARQFEVFHGRMKTSELTAFALESVTAYVTTLNPSDFDDGRMVDQDTPWFVDFFAPWCPPCRALLPELRKASNLITDIRIGSVDCVMHGDLCTKFGIHSYPTTFLFNRTQKTEYNGHHHAHSIKTFIEDIVNPPYVTLTTDTFTSLVHNREPGVVWVIDFYANWCGPCRALMPEWKKMAKMLGSAVKVGAIDCAANDEQHKVCKRQLVDAFPEVRIYPAKKTKSSKPLYIPFEGRQRQAHRLAAWVLEHLPNEVKTMELSDYKNGVLKSKDPWVIDFYAGWCGPCHAFMPKFMLTAMKFKGSRLRFGKIDCQKLPSICSIAGIRAYPTLVFFPPGEGRVKQSHKRFIDSQDPNEITEMINQYMEAYPEPEKKTEEKENKKSKDEL